MLTTCNLRIMTGTGGLTVAWFVVMFENLTKSVSHMVCLIWKFSRDGWRTAFLQATQNGARTAIVFAPQSKTHILKSSGFWFYNIITHWGHPGKGAQKSNQNRNVEAKNCESNRTVIIVINVTPLWIFQVLEKCCGTLKLNLNADLLYNNN